MLEGYFDLDGVTGQQVAINRKRLLAVQAALEIAKAKGASQHLINDMEAVRSSVAEVADAIQAALETK